MFLLCDMCGILCHLVVLEHNDLVPWSTCLKVCLDQKYSSHLLSPLPAPSPSIQTEGNVGFTTVQNYGDIDSKKKGIMFMLLFHQGRWCVLEETY